MSSYSTVSPALEPSRLHQHSTTSTISQSQYPKSHPKSTAALSPRAQHQQYNRLLQTQISTTSHGTLQRRIYSTMSQQLDMDCEKHVAFITEEQMRERMREAARRVREEENYLGSSTQTAINPALLNNAQEDPQSLFQSIIAEMEQEIGRENMRFPQEMYFLLGAPGAGKGTMERALSRELNLTSGAIVVSDLLNTLEMQKMKDNGLLINDRVVVEILLRKLLEDQYQGGCIIDGFPRSFVQSNVVSLLYEYIGNWKLEQELACPVKTTSPNNNGHITTKYRKPLFRMLVLYVDEHTSVQRQLARGRKLAENNRRFLETGHGSFEELRKTDCNVDAARTRYKYFAKNAFESLQFLRKKFPFNYIDASGEVNHVEQQVVEEIRMLEGWIERRRRVFVSAIGGME